MTDHAQHEQHTGTPRTVTCPRCGKAFTCGMSTSCWCATRVVPEKVRKELAARYDTCICSACLDQLIGNRQP
ncbi:MAG: cysteine-rich CWC family protein [Chlorobiaceae bacterium]|nr:cysteine-rich CWC family protein [Chlorobiaceae bacterium]NTW74739.1 cysteine-rich CWC family protein [Chlorobiaceae bacterium]